MEVSKHWYLYPSSNPIFLRKPATSCPMKGVCATRSERKPLHNSLRKTRLQKELGNELCPGALNKTTHRPMLFLLNMASPEWCLSPKISRMKVQKGLWFWRELISVITKKKDLFRLCKIMQEDHCVWRDSEVCQDYHINLLYVNKVERTKLVTSE